MSGRVICERRLRCRNGCRRFRAVLRRLPRTAPVCTAQDGGVLVRCARLRGGSEDPLPPCPSHGLQLTVAPATSCNHTGTSCSCPATPGSRATLSAVTACPRTQAVQPDVEPLPPYSPSSSRLHRIGPSRRREAHERI
jgi:hypothetical protein